MKRIAYLIAALAVAPLFFTGCATRPVARPYHVIAYKPHDPAKVRVDVSTSTGTVYVMEGDRCLMAAACCVGENNATHLGHHSVIAKERTKRSGSFGFSRSGVPADIHKGQSVEVGYPMAFWVEFEPSYGFHEGFVWSIPRTHGCIRLHKQAAARLFALTRIGTPVDIATTQPEDATLGKTVMRLDQRNDPDPAPSLLMSSQWFQDPPGPLLIEQ
jgi:hypothetical protein